MDALNKLSPKTKTVFYEIPHDQWISKTRLYHNLRPDFFAEETQFSLNELVEAGLIEIRTIHLSPTISRDFVALKQASDRPPKWPAEIGHQRLVEIDAVERMSHALQRIILLAGKAGNSEIIGVAKTALWGDARFVPPPLMMDDQETQE